MLIVTKYIEARVVVHVWFGVPEAETSPCLSGWHYLLRAIQTQTLSTLLDS